VGERETYDDMRYLALTLAGAAVLLAGCGGGGSSATASAPAKPRPGAARTLVTFQRNGGLAATLDELTVRTDATATLDKRYGGAGRRADDFVLRAAAFSRLQRALAALPQRLPDVPGGASKGATYLLSYRGRSLAAREGALPHRGAAAFRLLNTIVDGDERR
jgi:hypothetical protein